MFTKMIQSLRRVYTLLSRRSVIVPVIVAVTALCLAVSITSVNTFIVHEGDVTTVHKSYSDDAVRVLKNVGIPLQELDSVKVEQKEDRTFDVEILRAGQVEIIADGITLKAAVRSGDSVTNVLERVGLKLGLHDIVTPTKDSTVMHGGKITISRVQVTQTVKTLRIPFEKVTRKSNKIDMGKTVVAQEGKNGQKQQTFEVITRDGVVVSEKLMKEVVITQPQNKIIEQGSRGVSSGGTLTVNRGGGGTPIRYRKVIDVVATAYSSELISNKGTATGAIARVGLIAVDPRVIPLGTRLYITSADGKRWIYGYAVAADTGGAIKGNKIDLFFNTERECRRFGVQRAKVYILD